MSLLNLFVVNPEATPVKRVVLDISMYDVLNLGGPVCSDEVDMAFRRDMHVTWYVSERMRVAGIPVAPLTGRLLRGTMTWYDLCDAPVRRYVWEDVEC